MGRRPDGESPQLTLLEEVAKNDRHPHRISVRGYRTISYASASVLAASVLAASVLAASVLAASPPYELQALALRRV